MNISMSDDPHKVEMSWGKIRREISPYDAHCTILKDKLCALQQSSLQLHKNFKIFLYGNTTQN
jgi:hypothetical protein